MLVVVLLSHATATDNGLDVARQSSSSSSVGRTALSRRQKSTEPAGAAIGKAKNAADVIDQITKLSKEAIAADGPLTPAEVQEKREKAIADMKALREKNAGLANDLDTLNAKHTKLAEDAETAADKMRVLHAQVRTYLYVCQPPCHLATTATDFHHCSSPLPDPAPHLYIRDRTPRSVFMASSRRRRPSKPSCKNCRSSTMPCRFLRTRC